MSKWTAKDIKCGVVYHRGTDNDIDYMASTLHKIGWLSLGNVVDMETLPLDENAEGLRLYVSMAMGDGCVTMLGTAEDAAKKLNDGGYRKTTQNDMRKLIEIKNSFLRFEDD